jgi:hypothetical protein
MMRKQGEALVPQGQLSRPKITNVVGNQGTAHPLDGALDAVENGVIEAKHKSTKGKLCRGARRARNRTTVLASSHHVAVGSGGCITRSRMLIPSGVVYITVFIGNAKYS